MSKFSSSSTKAQSCIYDVIIIGGGASGLGTLSKLHQNGITNCLLIEAQEILGGRICTKTHGNHCLEYGAHWIHGEEMNIVYSLAKENKMIDDEPSLKQTGIGDTVFVDEDGSVIDHDLVDEFQEIIEEISLQGEKELCSYKDGLGVYFSNKFSKVNKWGATGWKLLDWHGRFRCCIDGSNTWFDPSGVGNTVYQECPGNPIVNWTNGYKTLIDYLTKDIPSSMIRLNSPVKRIVWNCLDSSLGTPVVNVELVKGEVITSKHVIFTPSLAVLKHCHRRIFEPELPLRNVSAIEGLAIDVVDKIFLEFPHKWWPDCDGFSFLRRNPPEEISAENWESGVLGFYEAYKQPRILCAWLTGKAAAAMEKCLVPEVQDRCVRLLKSRLGHLYNIPEPVWCDRSSWLSNPYCKGSYSFRSVMTEVMEVTSKDLAYPLYEKGVPLVCFAGEATHDIYYSTVHGAVETGWREADRIISYISSCKDFSKRNPSSVDVVIVGAGICGLGAAKHLEENQNGSILILEASNNIGGRVATRIPASGGFVDLGAQWIHGQHRNPLYDAVVSRGFIASSVSADGEGDFYTDEGEKLYPELVSEVLDACHLIKEECTELAWVGKREPPSMGEYIDARFEEYLDSLGGANGLSVDEQRIRRAIYQWDIRWERIDNACDSLHQLSAKKWSDYGTCEGFFNLNPKYGMASLIHFLRAGLKTEIKLNMEVVEIDYAEKVIRNPNSHCYSRANGAKPVRIKCRNGAEFDCDHVIVTSSLGYLKKHNDTLFRPPLPPSINNAIRNLGFGVIDKIFLEFDEPFWTPDFTGFHLVWTGEKIPNFQREAPHSQLIGGRSIEMCDFWYRAISSFDPVFGHKSTLCAWIAGPEAEYMERLSPAEVGETCLYLLRKFTGKKDIPKPIRVYRSQWALNDFILGSYSHRLSSKDGDGDDIVGVLNTPICASVQPCVPKDATTERSESLMMPVVTLAGESLSAEFYSTLHGAYANGMTQASHYTQFIKRVKRDQTVGIIKSKL